VRWALPVLAAVIARRVSERISLRLASRRVFGKLLDDMLYLDTMEMLTVDYVVYFCWPIVQTRLRIGRRGSSYSVYGHREELFRQSVFECSYML
jgi:hypothetical protein